MNNGSRGSIVAAFLPLALVAAIATGCGGGGSDSSTTAEPSGNSTDGSSTSGGSKGSESEGGTEAKSPPSTGFLGKGENGKLATLGTVAEEEEREAASQAIEASLQAREAEDWETQCSSLAAATIKQIERSGTVLGAQPGCAKALETQAQPTPPAARADTMTGPIDVLRVVGGGKGLAFFHGTEGKDYVIPVKLEGGEWKVEALQEQQIR